ncbi:MAG: DEAD/DEAH box helicase [Candidatus Thorarchaeota archaeon]
MIFVSTKQDFISHPLIKENTVIRRAYQENIFINCLNKNCLVVIPTGLGKTILGLMLAAQRLSDLPDSKVIFLAPTKPLVNQHYKSFLNLTNIPENNLVSLTGDISPDKRLNIWREGKVAFMTPQVLQNDIISNLYPIRDVSLIIFDECHRAVGDYAYCFIAQKYMELAENAQILGLTASPGSTEGKINDIKDNLFINHIEIRTDSDSDVKPYIHKVDNEWIKIALPTEFLEISKIFIGKLRNIYKWLKQLGLLNSSDINKITRNDLLKLNTTINKKISSSRDDREKIQLFTAKKYTSNAIRLSHMQELIETQGINALKDYLDKIEEKIKRNTANKSLKELYRDYEYKRMNNLVNSVISKGIIHPKLEKLVDILQTQLAENPNSRILVFCHFRDSVNNIVKFLDNNSIIKAHKFVGQQKRAYDKGLSQKEQINILENFKDGIFNTLVGTSVAEEGLDIMECDLVIFYDVVPSAIRSIQRRGRTGRGKEGKVYILMAENTRDEGYYWAERSKEKNMRKSLKKIKESESSLKEEQPSLLNFMNKRDTQQIEKNENLKQETIQNESFIIICDNRETSSSVVRNLSLMGVKLKLEQLKVADYVISERIGIERKSSQDFNDSLKDGRLFNELIDLKNNFELPILILEDDPFVDSAINENALYGAITSIILNLGIMIYKTKDTSETAKFISQLAKKEFSESKGKPKLRFEKKPIEINHLLEYIVAGIPGINSLRAKNLLKDLKSLQNIFNAEYGELMRVESIGKKIAEEILKISRYKYANEDTE